MSLSRRRFLEAAALSGWLAQHAAGYNQGIPMRTLGRTGAKVTILAFGCGSRWLQYKDEDQGLEALELGIQSGINYLDTAISYGNGVSETRVGKLMPKYRGQVWLTTKMNARKADAALRAMDESLKRLQTNQVDLLHIHALADAADLSAIEAKDGLLEAMYRIREQKLARFIGVTCHTDPAVLRTALERHDFDCTQMALNAARAGMVSPTGGFGMSHPMRDGFESIALPVANKKNLGVIAMKVFAQEGLNGAAAPEKLLSYSASLPVTSCVVGMPQLSMVKQNVAWARGFRPMAEPERRRLGDEISAQRKASLDRYFLHHHDA
jgi:uncharacterized protein